MLNWIKNNKVTTALIVIALAYVSSNIDGSIRSSFNRVPMENGYSYQYGNLPTSTADYGMVNSNYGVGAKESTSPSSNRIVITDNSASLVVKDVKSAKDQLLEKVEAFGGFMVNSSINKPTESAYGEIKVRVPVEKSNEFIKYFESIAVKVSSFSTRGRDVTDQYSDLEAKLEVLNESYRRIEVIYDEATTVDEMLRVQQQLFSLRDQIDSVIGRKKYIEDTSSTVAYTIYLSTDEYSLPYAPDGNWRPEVTYKLAVRGLISDLRGIGNRAIWFFVYAVIWIPALILFLIIWRLFKKSIRRNQ